MPLGEEEEFLALPKTYFPKLYDIKYLIANQDGFHGGLNKLGDDLAVSISAKSHVKYHSFM